MNLILFNSQICHVNFIRQTRDNPDTRIARICSTAVEHSEWKWNQGWGNEILYTQHLIQWDEYQVKEIFLIVYILISIFFITGTTYTNHKIIECIL